MADKVQLIKEEIERLKEHTAKCGYPGQGEFENGNREGRNWVCDKLLQFINTIPEEPTSEDLEEAADKYANKFQTWNIDDDTSVPRKYGFCDGAKWHENKMKEALQTEYEKGRFDMREEMMKDAVEGEIYGNIRNQEEEPYEIYAESDNLPLNGKLKMGDRVKIFIVK